MEVTAQQLVNRGELEAQLNQNRAELQRVLENEETLAKQRAYLEEQIAALKQALDGYDLGYEYALAEVRIKAEQAERERSADKEAKGPDEEVPGA